MPTPSSSWVSGGQPPQGPQPPERSYSAKGGAGVQRGIVELLRGGDAEAREPALVHAPVHLEHAVAAGVLRRRDELALALGDLDRAVLQFIGPDGPDDRLDLGRARGRSWRRGAAGGGAAVLVGAGFFVATGGLVVGGAAAGREFVETGALVVAGDAVVGGAGMSAPAGRQMDPPGNNAVSSVASLTSSRSASGVPDSLARRIQKSPATTS